MILSTKRIIKALISMHGCAGWYAPVLFANPRGQVFSRRGPNNGVNTERVRMNVGLIQIYSPCCIYYKQGRLQSLSHLRLYHLYQLKLGISFDVQGLH